MSTSMETPEISCAFCAIARGEDESVEILLEESSFVAFFPMMPSTPGHTLIIPRKHVKDLWSADAAMAKDLIEAVIRIGEAIKVALHPEGLNLISSAGAAAEQTVPHLHLHLVPRSHDDALDIWPEKKPTAGVVKKDLADEIRAAL